MTNASYLEHYLDSLQHLPVELQRNFNLMRDLDNRAHNLMKVIDLTADNILPELGLLDSESKRQRLDDIQGLFDKAKEFCDDKVQLAIQTYELVDKHIRRLDSDLARFDSEIQDKVINSRAAQLAARELEEPAKGRKKHREKTSHGKKKRSGLSSEDDSSKLLVVAKKQNAEPEIHPSDVLDMPVDPNEPTYCLCSQVSYGEMIGCDNVDCPIEWFHFACVNLMVKPKGKWYCPKCSLDRKRK